MYYIPGSVSVVFLGAPVSGKRTYVEDFESAPVLSWYLNRLLFLINAFDSEGQGLRAPVATKETVAKPR